MFKILSGASKDSTRYQMLRKIGVRRELLIQSIYKELFFVFLVPAIVGIVHVLVGINMFSVLLADPYFRIWLPIIIFVVIYSIYYLITVQLYKRIVLPKEKWFYKTYKMLNSKKPVISCTCTSITGFLYGNLMVNLTNYKKLQAQFYIFPTIFL